MYVANKDFHNPFTGLIVYKGQAVLLPASEKEGDTLKKLLEDKTVIDSDTAIGAYGSAKTEGVHDRSQLTERDLPTGPVTDSEPQRFHDGTMASALEERKNREADQTARAKADAEAPPVDPSKMSKADLEAYAAEKGVDIAEAKTKADIIAAIEAAGKPA